MKLIIEPGRDRYEGRWHTKKEYEFNVCSGDASTIENCVKSMDNWVSGMCGITLRNTINGEKRESNFFVNIVNGKVHSVF